MDKFYFLINKILKFSGEGGGAYLDFVLGAREAKPAAYVPIPGNHHLSIK
jgi:hypothetical protein